MLAFAGGSNVIVNIVIYLVPMILSLTVHEYAHARVAWALGDDTASRQGRLTLNPIEHIDVLGTLIIPAVNVLAGGFALIGWAKPVPVSPVRFNRKVTMRTGMILTAAAGPVSNLLLAIISIAVATVLVRVAPTVLYAAGPTAVAKLLQAMFIMNIGLCIFNLLPLPPLDGSRLLPRSMDHIAAAIAPYSFLILLVFINLPFLRTWLLERPVVATASILQNLFGTSLW